MIKSGMSDTSKKDKYLTVVLDKGDEVIESIETAFKEQNIKKAVLIEGKGYLKDIKMAISRAGTLRQRVYTDSLKIKKVSGEFNKAKDDYFGDMNVSLEQDPIHVISGVLLKGYADSETTLRFKIIKDIDFGINKNKGSENRNMVKEKLQEETKKEKKPFIVS